MIIGDLMKNDKVKSASACDWIDALLTLGSSGWQYDRETDKFEKEDICLSRKALEKLIEEKGLDDAIDTVKRMDNEEEEEEEEAEDE
jgi:hypothetical protein